MLHVAFSRKISFSQEDLYYGESLPGRPDRRLVRSLMNGLAGSLDKRVQLLWSPKFGVKVLA